MRKISLFIAMSLDGYIAKENGEYDWIKGQGDNSLDTDDKWRYEESIKITKERRPDLYKKACK